MVVVPRETPVTRSHLEHLLALHDAGAVVLPASPGFYAAGATASAEQLVDFVAGKVLDALGVPHTLFTRWTGRMTPRRTDGHAAGATAADGTLAASVSAAAAVAGRSRRSGPLRPRAGPGPRTRGIGGGRPASGCC